MMMAGISWRCHFYSVEITTSFYFFPYVGMPLLEFDYRSAWVVIYPVVAGDLLFLCIFSAMERAFRIYLLLIFISLNPLTF